VKSEWHQRLEEILSELGASPERSTAWTALYNHVWPYVYTLIRRKLKDDPAGAEDITQEVFLGLIRRSEALRRFSTAEEFCRYLTVVSRNATIDHYRRQTRHEVTTEGLDRVTSGTLSPEDLARFEELLRKLLGELSEDDSELAALLIRGYRPKEIIAMKHGKWSDANVYTRLSRLRDKLGAIVAEYSDLQIRKKKDPSQ
jgi:RNA polymerase sigma factor (sigma-70 family)